MAAATIFTSLYAFATGYPTTGIAAAAISAALLIGGLGWLRRERRRVRRIEIEYVKKHPHADAQIPTS